MKQTVVGATIIAVGLVLASLAFGGRYQVVGIEEDAVVRVDRFTGELAYCRRWEKNVPICLIVPEAHHDGKTPLLPDEAAPSTNQS